MPGGITSYFFDLVREDGKTVIKKCKLCLKEYRGSKKQGNFISHMKQVHTEEFEEYRKNTHNFKIKIAATPSPQSTTMRVKSEYSPETIALKGKILKFEKMLIASGISLDVANNSEFKDFVYELDSRFQMPRSETLKRDLKRHYESVEALIRSMLQESSVIITSLDFWVTKFNVMYLSINAHYVTKTWNYEHKLLTLKRIFGIPNEATIMDEYNLILRRFGINNSVFLNIVSNAANLLNAFQLNFLNEVGDTKMATENLYSCEDDYTFNEFLEVNNLLRVETYKINGIVNQNECFIHTLLLVIQDSIPTVDALVQTLQICGEILFYIRQTSVADAELKLILQQCLDARRLSGIHMFQKFSEVYQEIILILEQSGHECCVLSQTQLEILQEFIDILQPFQEAIDFVFNESVASISKCLPTTIALGRHLQLFIPIHLKPLIQQLTASFEKRFQGIYEDPVYVISTILHPAWKMTPFIHVDKQFKAKEILINELKGFSGVPVMDIPEPNVKKSRLSLMFQDIKSNIQHLTPSYVIEFESYIKDDQIDEDDDPFLFWKLNESKYPNLSQMSKKYLAIPAISMPIDKMRNLTDDIIQDHTNFRIEDLFSKTSVLKYNLDLF